MVEAEHMDWHEDLDEYIAAKQQLFMNQAENDVAIYYSKNENSEAVAGASEGELIPYMQKPGAEVIQNEVVIDGLKICDVSELKLLGKHNWQNVCAAVTAAWQITQDVPAIKQAVTSFGGLPFRIEPRETKNGVRYYNDSFATGPGAARAAIAAIPGTKVLILGGYDRGLDLAELAETIIEYQSDIRKVVLVGASAERTAATLKKAGFDNYVLSPAKNMTEIVQAATEQAQADDAVVLSPAFASFDMFKNFEDRGTQFNETVAKLWAPTGSLYLKITRLMLILRC